jgi:hypothetical protein
MNGVEFLEQAMDLVPQARRALLTAYADTDAAISAINVVDVDHYLLKPWNRRRRSSTRWWTSCWPPGSARASRRAPDQDPRAPVEPGVV